MDDVLGTSDRIDYYGGAPNVRWSLTAKKPTLLETEFTPDGPRLGKFDLATRQATPFHDAAAMEKALAALPGVPPDMARRLSRSFRLEPSETMTLLRLGNDILVYNFTTQKAARVTNTPEMPKQVVTLSPDGTHIAYAQASNLYAVPVVYGGMKPAVALTTDGGGEIQNGVLDWVYEEEVYGRGKPSGYEWSPDGKSIAFLRLDETPVPTITLTDHIPTHPTYEPTRYPKAGDPNPKVGLAVVPVDGSSKPRFIDLAAYPAEDRIIARFGFTPDSKTVLVQVQNKIQNFLHLLAASPSTGKVTRLIEETTAAWVNVLGEPEFLPDGTFLWQSERTGWKHLYHYDITGKLLGAVTKGEWDVKNFYGVDPAGVWVYVSGNKESAIGDSICKVRLDGTAEPVLLSRPGGDHNASFDPTFTLYIDRWSDLSTPTQVRIHRAADGSEQTVLSQNKHPKETMAPFALGKPEHVVVTTRDGYKLDGILLKPADFDPKKKYPVFTEVYAGPASPTVGDKWGMIDIWHQYLCQQGYLIWYFDNRSATTKSAKASWTIYKNMGASELRDIEDGLSYLKTLPYVDGDRFGIFGWSYGGFMVEYALTHSNFFKVGIAGAGVADWGLYDSIYTERYMSTPQLNPDGYLTSSPIKAAAKLHGKLLLIHGTRDDNVHMQNTLTLAYQLQMAGKQFDMMLYPRSRHGLGSAEQNRQMRVMVTDFILKNL